MKSKLTKINSYALEFGNETFTNNNGNLFCNGCSCVINHSRRSLVLQHLNTIKHKSNIISIKINSINKLQKNIHIIPANENSKTKKEIINTKEKFCFDLVKILISNNIPLYKLENKDLKTFLIKYTGFSLPDRTTLSKNYLKPFYQDIFTKIKKELYKEYIFVSIDETTDICGRKICLFLIGTLRISEPSKIYLINSEYLEKVNSTTISQFFLDSLNIFYDNKIDYNKILAFITDSASYMQKSFKCLKIAFINMVHINCYAHNLHRVCEFIRYKVPNIDFLSNNLKKLFKKSHINLINFKKTYKNIPAIPFPTVTRWGTWLTFIIFIKKYFNEIKEFCENLPTEESNTIQNLKSIFKKKLKPDLHLINYYFINLPIFIKQLQTKNMTLKNSLLIKKKLQI